MFQQRPELGELRKSKKIWEEYGSQSSRWLPMTLASWYLCPCVVSPLILYQDWSMWPVEYGGNDGVWLLRLGHKRHGHFHLDLLEHSLEKASCHIMRIFKQIYGGGPHGEGLRYPANNSQYWVVCHVKKLSWKWTLQLQIMISYCNFMRNLELEHLAYLASLEILIHRNYGIVNAYCFK